MHFIVTTDGTDVISFASSDGYNAGCKFHGGAGGLKTFSVAVPRMSLSSSGSFNGKVFESNKPFTGTTTIQIRGRINGTHASGTLDVPGKTCGAGASNPAALMYLETFTATRG